VNRRKWVIKHEGSITLTEEKQDTFLQDWQSRA
jgi:hypothetical protein